MSPLLPFGGDVGRCPWRTGVKTRRATRGNRKTVRDRVGGCGGDGGTNPPPFPLPPGGGVRNVRAAFRRIKQCWVAPGELLSPLLPFGGGVGRCPWRMGVERRGATKATGETVRGRDGGCGGGGTNPPCRVEVRPIRDEDAVAAQTLPQTPSLREGAYERARSISAICTALSAAPLRS